MKGKIIDAHLHFWPGQEYFDEIALAAGHENTSEHLQKAYEENNIVMGIVMGNGTLEKERHVYPPYLRYCIGLDRNFVNTYGIDSAIE
ncbi:MAG: hypothetical protein ACLUFF_08015, partial [Acutalibacteraceae bacterium]